MLDIFCDWARKTSEYLSTAEVDARLTMGADSANPAALFDIDTPSAVARITCWESGDFHAEILDLESGQYIFSKNGRFDATAPLSFQTGRFFALLNIDPLGVAKRLKQRRKKELGKPRKEGASG